MRRMKIVLDGVETNNKGAELMFYAILQEIERKYPNAVVYINSSRVKQGFSYLKTSLELKDKPIASFEKWCRRLHLCRIVKRLLGDDFFQDIHGVRGSSFFLDDSGFYYSDQWNLPLWMINQRKKLIRSQKRHGSKVVFLPQAFGPITQDNVKQGIADLNLYANVVMPREKTSNDYLLGTGLIDKTKIRMFPDFTCLVDGDIPENYSHLANGVCIVPNIRMLDKSNLTFEDYNSIIQSVIRISYDNGYTPYLLNHEGADDGELARKIQTVSEMPVEVVDGLNALEVKGLISTAYLVVSSRFHGVVSALNSCVPCLATSWSHKYAELYNDYHQSNGVLPIDDKEMMADKLEYYLNKDNNKRIREELKSMVAENKRISRKMWDEVWAL